MVAELTFFGTAGNVSFAQHDISQGMIGANYDLVVCSEILYYLRDCAAIEHFSRQVCNSMKPGGHLLMTHANMVSDDKSATGFDFHEIGAKGIGTIFLSCAELNFCVNSRLNYTGFSCFSVRSLGGVQKFQK